MFHFLSFSSTVVRNTAMLSDANENDGRDDFSVIFLEIAIGF
jgi:hypothetical protein